MTKPFPLWEGFFFVLRFSPKTATLLFMRLALIVSILVASLALNAQTLQGRVVRVADGDTITILDEAKVQNKVRLNKIDAPEKRQAFGEVSRKHLASMVASKVVQVQWEKRDKYGRILGDMPIGEVNANLEMVKSGLVWYYKRFDTTTIFAQAENDARVKKVGLWKDSNLTPPWEFRKQNRK